MNDEDELERNDDFINNVNFRYCNSCIFVL